jgi:hypothetical protein
MLFDFGRQGVSPWSRQGIGSGAIDLAKRAAGRVNGEKFQRGQWRKTVPRLAAPAATAVELVAAIRQGKDPPGARAGRMQPLLLLA